MKQITRRDFIRTSALAAGGIALGTVSCGGEPTAPMTPTARVAAVRGKDLYGMTREVLEGVGGLGDIVHEGESVFLKPNMVTLPWSRYGDRFAAGECTKPEIVTTVAEECLRAGAASVTIGDGSQMPQFDWSEAITLNRSRNLQWEAERLASEYGRPVKVASLEVDSPQWIEVPSRTYLGKIAVYSLLAEADRVISIPVAKTHSWAQLTLSLKNFVGTTPLKRYAAQVSGGSWDRGKVFDHSSPQAIAQIYLDVVNALQPDLAIIDFSIGVEGDGPTVGQGSGRTVDMRDRLGSWLLLASTDLVAADSTAARIMSHDAAKVKQLTMAHEMGLGESRESYIEVVGERLDDLIVDWLPASLKRTSRRRGPAGAHPYSMEDQTARG